MQYRKNKRKTTLLVAAVLAGILLVAAVLAWWIGREPAGEHGAGGSLAVLSTPSPAVSGGGASGLEPLPAAYPAPAMPEEMRAMWISFLEWEKADISTEAAMRAAAGEMFDNCVLLHLNTVMVAVRSFSDALYPSAVYPWSHLLTGTQGQDPGYDPLAVLVEEAHARGLRIEAWINPYRVNGTVNGPAAFSADNPAVLHPEWLRELNGSWLDPGIPEVRQLVCAGVAEIVQNYEVDGVHFDDYFYPEANAEQKEAGEDVAFDAATFDTYGAGNALGAWRRENVNLLVQQAYATVKEADPALTFGISPQGNNENNYNIQYSDVKLWMATPGYVDYVMPQLYWGFDYRTSSGRDTYAFANICAEWAGYARSDAVRLYAGLGAYRIGAGDGGSNEQTEWSSGHTLADMVLHLRGVPGFSGFSLFRYEFLFWGDDPLRALEGDALAALLAPLPVPESVSGTE